MARIRLIATLKEEAGAEELRINGGGKLRDILAEARRRIDALKRVIGEDGEPAPTILVLVDGVDYRLLGKELMVDEDTEITIIPVIHGG